MIVSDYLSAEDDYFLIVSDSTDLSGKTCAKQLKYWNRAKTIASPPMDRKFNYRRNLERTSREILNTYHIPGP